MNAKQYIDAVLRCVQTDRKTKQRLREDLTQDIEGRMQAGEPLSEVLLDMGSAQAAAARLQESIGGYIRESTLAEKALRFTSAVFAAVGLLALFQITFSLVAGWIYTRHNITIAPEADVTVITQVHAVRHGGSSIAIDILPYLVPVVLLLAALVCYISYRLLRRRK